MLDDHLWLRRAVELSLKCPPVETAYSVGAIIVSADGIELSRGYSRENDPVVHAEESAIAKLSGRSVSLAGATIYSSMEPCSTRRSRPRSCTELILAAGISRVVFALQEPVLFADCQGAELLERAGVQVVRIPAMGPWVREINGQLLRR